MNNNKTLITKFGNVRIYNDYYYITSRKEGNHGKYLHRLVWEEHYGKPVPEGYVIHHINGNKLDNRIQNLQCMEDRLHRQFHKKGENNHNFGKKCLKHSEYMKKRWKNDEYSKEIGKKMSEGKTTTGIYRVSKIKDKSCKQGFIWCYDYHDSNGKRKFIRRVNLNDLEKEVKKRGLEWIILDEKKAKKTIKEDKGVKQ